MASATPLSSSPTGHSAFFYGTLMAPQVLHRVCHGNASATNPLHTLSNLRIQPAILHHYRRARVRDADYPGIAPQPGAAVRGTYVTGLTDGDLWRLDLFEGDEYAREAVAVRVLERGGRGEGEGQMGGGSVDGEEEGEEVPCETYVFKPEVRDRLMAEEWDFGEFVREKLRDWVGERGAAEYAEVDEAVAAAARRPEKDGTGGRGPNGHIGHALEQEHRKQQTVNDDH